MEPNKFNSIVKSLMVVTTRSNPNHQNSLKAKTHHEDNVVLRSKPKVESCKACNDQVTGQVMHIYKDRMTNAYPIWVEKCYNCKAKWTIRTSTGKSFNRPGRQEDSETL